MTRRALAILAALLLLATSASSAQAPVLPEGTAQILVLLSDGMTMHPVAGGVLPLRCEVAP